MKRGMGGGAHRGPIAPGRQRRTIRMMQALLVLTAVGMLLFAGYSWGRASTFDEGLADELDARRAPSAAAVIVPALLGVGSLIAAFLLQAGPGVRLLTPARLEEMASRGAPPTGAPDHEEASAGDEGKERTQAPAGRDDPSSV